MFHHGPTAIFLGNQSRSKDVVEDFLGDWRPDFWISDRYGGQMGWATKDHQFCLAHLMRDVQYAIDGGDDVLAPRLLDLLADACAVGRRRDNLTTGRCEPMRPSSTGVSTNSWPSPHRTLGPEATQDLPEDPRQPLRLRHQSRRQRHQQRIRTRHPALHNLPKDHQRLPRPMGSQPIRRHPRRRRNRPTTRRPRHRRHPPHPPGPANTNTRLTARAGRSRRNCNQQPVTSKGVSNYNFRPQPELVLPTHKTAKNLPARRCIFCGNSGLSYEHLWSAWIGKHVARSSHDKRLDTTDHFPDPKGPPAPREMEPRHGHTTTMKIKAVCKTCNNGWMSQLDNDTKPILEPLMLGRKSVLSEDRQLTLVRWVMTKVFVMEYERNVKSTSTSNDLREFFIDRLIPSGIEIHLLNYIGGEWSYQINRHVAGIFRQAYDHPGHDIFNSQCVTIGIGKLAINVLQSPQIALEFPHSLDYSRRLWPKLTEELDWPPPYVLNDKAIHGIAHSLHSYTITTPNAIFIPPLGPSRDHEP